MVAGTRKRGLLFRAGVIASLAEQQPTGVVAELLLLVCRDTLVDQGRGACNAGYARLKAGIADCSRSERLTRPALSGGRRVRTRPTLPVRSSLAQSGVDTVDSNALSRIEHSLGSWLSGELGYLALLRNGVTELLDTLDTVAIG